jgi:hypothetical protein
MINQPQAEQIASGIHDLLERAYIEEYLRGLGHSLESLKHLPEPQARQLMRAASQAASLRLSEVENKSHFVEDMHGGTPPL